MPATAPGYDPNKPPKPFGPPAPKAKFSPLEYFIWVAIIAVLRAAGVPWVFTFAAVVIFHFLWPTIRKAKQDEQQSGDDLGNRA